MITLSYGHADKIAGHAGGTPAAGNTPPIDPALYRREDVRRVLAERDITALYRILRDAGTTQRRIAELTGQSQSEVSEILKGALLTFLWVDFMIVRGGVGRGRRA